MRKLRLFAAAILAMHCLIAQAEGFQVGVGIFTLANNGADIQINYRLPQSHYQLGYKYTHWTDVFHDPYSGNAHSSTTNTLTGPVLIYLMRPEADSSYYFGVSLLNWQRTETPLIVVAPSDTQSRTDPYFGGGYTGLIGKNVFYNLGIFISPTASMKTQTSISSEDQNGNFDIQIQIGLAF